MEQVIVLRALTTDVLIASVVGDIVVRLDGARAPCTTENFLRHVDRKLYDGGTFHRTVTLLNQPNDSARVELIQGRMAESRNAVRLAPIALERTSLTGLTHQAGTISMARSGPDSATSGFFICVTDQPDLDFGGRRNADGQGFAAFGQVVQGMDVVRRIHQSPAEGQRLTPEIEITYTESRQGNQVQGRR